MPTYACPPFDQENLKQGHYNALHVCCPKCGSRRITSTRMVQHIPDHNKAQCDDCMWQGIVDDLAEPSLGRRN